MSLNCAMSFNVTYVAAGSSPLPQATLTVFNPNASAVSVTGIQLSMFDPLNRPISPATNLPTPAMGPGQTLSVPALGTITFGPFPLAVGSAAAASGPGSVPIPNTLGNQQIAEPPQQQMMLGGVVMASDGSLNTIVPAGIIVSYTSAALLLAQGGALNFNTPNGSNLLTGLIMGVL